MKGYLLLLAVIALFVTACAPAVTPTPMVTPTVTPNPAWVTPERLSRILVGHGFQVVVSDGCGPTEGCTPYVHNGLDTVAVVHSDGGFGISPKFLHAKDDQSGVGRDQAILVDSVITEAYGKDVALKVRAMSMAALEGKGTQQTVLVEEEYFLQVKLVKVDDGVMLVVGILRAQ